MSAKPKTEKKAKTRYEGELTATSKRNRPATYYKLSEKDWPIIKKGLQQFASVYMIAAKIGCGYSTLKKYINEHEELKSVQEDAEKGETEFVKGKLLQKIAGGSLGAICFYMERKAGWTNKQKIETDGPLPNIVMGIIPDAELPTEGEPIRIADMVNHDAEEGASVAEKVAQEERAELKAIDKAETEAEREARSRPAVAAPVDDDDEDIDGDDDWGDDGPGIF